MQEHGSASLCQYYFALAQILAGRKREQLALAQPLDIARDGAGIAIEHASEGFHCRRAEVMHHHEQAELRNPQASSGQRGIISLCDSARRRAHGQTNTIAALVQFRKLSAPHVCSLSLAASAHNLVPEDRRLKRARSGQLDRTLGGSSSRASPARTSMLNVKAAKAAIYSTSPAERPIHLVSVSERAVPLEARWNIRV